MDYTFQLKEKTEIVSIIKKELIIHNHMLPNILYLKYKDMKRLKIKSKVYHAKSKLKKLMWLH